MAEQSHRLLIHTSFLLEQENLILCPPDARNLKSLNLLQHTPNNRGQLIYKPLLDTSDIPAETSDHSTNTFHIPLTLQSAETLRCMGLTQAKTFEVWEAWVRTVGRFENDRRDAFGEFAVKFVVDDDVGRGLEDDARPSEAMDRMGIDREVQGAILEREFENWRLRKSVKNLVRTMMTSMYEQLVRAQKMSLERGEKLRDAEMNGDGGAAAGAAQST